MAERVLPFTVTVPANTAIVAPALFPFQFPSARVERIDVRIPPGPSGTVGFAIQYGGGNFIPDTNGTWIIADNERIEWPLEGAPDGGNWSISAYNTDVLDHSLYFFFLVSNLTVQQTPDFGPMIGL